MARHLPPPAGKRYLCVTGYFLPEYPATNGFFSIAGQQHLRLLDSVTAIEPYGEWVRYGVFYAGAGISILQPSDYKEHPRPLPANVIFIVPADKKQFTFRVRDQQAVLDVPQQPARIDIDSSVSFTVKSARLIDSAPSGEGGGPIRNPNGKLLLVTCEWFSKGFKGSNNMPGLEPHLQFNHEWLNLRFGQGQVAPNAGTYSVFTKVVYGHRRDTGGNGMATSGAGGSKDTDGFIFFVPADLTDFELLYAGWPVAKGRVGN